MNPIAGVSEAPRTNASDISEGLDLEQRRLSARGLSVNAQILPQPTCKTWPLTKTSSFLMKIKCLGLEQP